MTASAGPMTALAQDAHDRAQGRGLAHAVAAQQGHDLGVLHLQGDTLEDVAVAYPGVDVVELDHRWHPGPAVEARWVPM